MKWLQKFKRYCKRELRRFKREGTGAVTVMVTILLVPSMLISGTAVDLARIYTAKSMTENATQLAANAVLTEYDALLQDFFGLYGAIEDDAWKTMLENYVTVSLYGNESTPDGLGTLQTFYGSDDISVDITSKSGQNLANVDVLRRQIEEYAKFRAPVVIVDRLLEFFDLFENTLQDKEIIEDKMEIDQEMSELNDIFENIYIKINQINQFTSDESNVYGYVNAVLRSLYEQYSNLEYIETQYENIFKPEVELTGDEALEEIELAKEEYMALLDNIKNLAGGGYVGENWNSGLWTNRSYVNGLEQEAAKGAEMLEAYLKELENLVTLCSIADSKKESLSQKIQSLRNDLESGKGTSALNSGMSADLEIYQKLLTYDLTYLAQSFQYENETIVKESSEIIENIKGFGRISSNRMNEYGARFTITDMKRLLSDFYNVQEPFRNQVKEINSYPVSQYLYTAPNQFKAFHNIQGGDHANFYQALQQLFGNTSETSENKKNILSVMSKIQEEFNSLTSGVADFTVGGKTTFPTAGLSDPTIFEAEGDWGKEGEAQESILSGLGSMFSSFADDAVNKVLLLVYCTEIFSNFTTNRNENDQGQVSMAGIPFGANTNYLYQSEQEYLLIGDESATVNLSAIYGLIYLIRFVANYTSTFTIDTINTPLNAMKVDLATTIIAELLRVAVAMGESLMDVTALRGGNKVVLVNTEATWILKVDSILSGNFTLEPKDHSDNPLAISYNDYMCIFLMTKDGDVIAERSCKLMEANVNLYRGTDIADTSDLPFKMEKTYTDFNISTTVTMKFIFLSLPLAQNFSSSVTAPTTFPIKAVASRGY